MSKTRGNKTSKAARAERQEKAVELMKTGETQEAIADQLGIDRTTFWRDLRAIEKKYVAGSTEAIIELKSKTLNAVAEQMDAVLAGTLPEGRANAWKGLVAEFSKIAFPRESHHLRMNLNVNPLAQGMYGVFNQHCADSARRHRGTQYGLSLTPYQTTGRPKSKTSGDVGYAHWRRFKPTSRSYWRADEIVLRI